MANSDYNIADQTGASFLDDMNNNILPSIVTNNSGTTSPTAAQGRVVGMIWHNTSTSTVDGIAANTLGVCTQITPSVVWTPVQTGAVNTTNIENATIGDLNGFHIQFNGDGIDFFNDTTHITRINASGIFTSGNVTASDSTPG